MNNIWFINSCETKNDNINSYNDNNYVNSWNNDNKKGLLKNSKINNGQNEVIFKDKFKNLWIIATKQKLQVLKVKLFTLPKHYWCY